MFKAEAVQRFGRLKTRDVNGLRVVAPSYPTR